MSFDPNDLDPREQEIFRMGLQAGAQQAMHEIQGQPSPRYADTIHIHTNPYSFHISFEWINGMDQMGKKAEMDMADISKVKAAYLIIPPVALKTMLQMLTVVLKRYEHKFGELAGIFSMPGVPKVVLDVPEDAERENSQVHWGLKDQSTSSFSTAELFAIADKYFQAMEDEEIDAMWVWELAVEMLGEEVNEQQSPRELILQLAAAGHPYVRGHDPTGRNPDIVHTATVQYGYRLARLHKAYGLGELSDSGIRQIAHTFIESEEVISNMATMELIKALAFNGFVFNPEDPDYACKKEEEDEQSEEPPKEDETPA